MLLCKCYINSILSVLYLRFWFFCKFSLFFCGVIHFLLFSFLPYNWTIHSRNGVFTANVCYVLPCRHLSSRDMMDQQKADEDPQKREAGNKGSTREILLPFSGVRSYPPKWGFRRKRLRPRMQTFARAVANVCGKGCKRLRLRRAKWAHKALAPFWAKLNTGRMVLPTNQWDLKNVLWGTAGSVDIQWGIIEPVLRHRYPH